MRPIPPSAWKPCARWAAPSCEAITTKARPANRISKSSTRWPKRALLWTRDQLSEEQRQWLRDLKLVRQVRDFTIVHATLDSPGSWGYVTNRFDAMASFSYQFTQVCFYGHTHVPRIFEKDDCRARRTRHRGQLQRGVKYFVNVGSVGQPRDGDWRAAYAIYDVQAQTISIRRLEYDIETAQGKIRAAGLPSLLADRLSLGK
jgi:diadenosine tetraphosphatase ApaH/serine/threonine PP2A family protein phosphatase